MKIKTLSLGAALLVLIGTAGGDTVAAQRAAANQGGQQVGKPSSPAKPGGTSAGTSQRTPSRKPWWQDEASKKELGLTPEQAASIDQIYTSAKEELSGYWDAREREEKELDRLIAESKVEQWVVARQIDKVETQRSNFNKLRIMTLYRMHRMLTPDQRVKLQQIRDRDHRDPRKRP
jgi:Spy/CpxP family protein refolding chaperone